MTKLTVLRSTEDASVNLVEQALVGFTEARYVRRTEERVNIYLSTQTGCNRGCRFCHLTATGQTAFEDVSINDLLGQANSAFKVYRREVPAKECHYSFMARGEPLASRVVLDSSTELLGRLGDMSLNEGLPCKFNVSTIMPRTLNMTLVQIFPYITPTLYYSLYSTDEVWRKKWMPGAMPVPEALGLLAEYQRFSKKIVKIHHTLIANENDSAEHAEHICNMLGHYGLLCEFNLVRYNPASPEQGSETSDQSMWEYMRIMRENLPGKVQTITRVGRDVHASCGTFFSGDE